jgi:hypothetical protein
VEILRDFLGQGASVHLRNRGGNTPLFLAAAAGLKDHVQTLMDAGAHLHSEEVGAAKAHAGEGDGEGAGEGAGEIAGEVAGDGESAGEGKGKAKGKGKGELWKQVIGAGPC